MIKVGFGRKARSYLPMVVLLVVAWLAYTIGSTLGTALVIFSIIIWSLVGLTLVYALLFRGVKLTLFSDDPEPQELAQAENAVLEERRDEELIAVASENLAREGR